MRNRFRAVIVDDERLARDAMKVLLAEHPEIQVVGEANNVQKAIEVIENLKPDVVFLDIQMPGGSGFELLNKIEITFKVIFVTAYDEHAIRAFEVNALDYLLKPVHPDRLANTIKRLLDNFDNDHKQLDRIRSVISDELIKALQSRVARDSGGSSIVDSRSYLPQAIMIVDICRHSSIVQKYGNHFFMKLLSVLQDTVHTAASRRQCSCLRGRGDGFLTTFSTIEEALEATLEIQKRIKDHNQAVAENERIWLRYALHFGETLVGDDGEPYGDAVNMAFKMEAIRGEHMIETQGGVPKSEFPQKDYILVSEVVYRDIKNRAGIVGAGPCARPIECRFLGLFELSGLVGLHRIYQIIM